MKKFELVGDNFLDFEIPKQKRYLLRYFKTKIQRCFLIYFLQVGNCDLFREHTGLACKDRWLENLKSKINHLEDTRAKAHEDFDLETLSIIDSGKYKIVRTWKI